jgi:sensor c-di-GMP phosphodiesterase-like protein
MKSIAEGTECNSELEVVKRCLCDVAQGYHYAEPLAPHEFINWLSSFQNQKTQVNDQLVLS